MRQRLMAMAVAAALLGTFPAARAADRPNVMPAGRFALDPKDNKVLAGWKTTSELGPDKPCRLVPGLLPGAQNLDIDAGHSATATLRLKPEWKLVDITTRLQIVKRDADDPQRSARFVVEFQHGIDTTPAAEPQFSELVPDREWTRVRMILAVPKDAQWIRISTGLIGTSGSLRVDYVELRPADESVLAALYESQRRAETQPEKTTFFGMNEDGTDPTNAPPVEAPGERTLIADVKVEAAIRRGVEFLFRHRQVGKEKSKDPKRDLIVDTAHWEHMDGFTGGETALVLYALLTTGQSLDDPRLKPHSKELQPAIQWLLNHVINRSYPQGLTANVLAAAPNFPTAGEYYKHLRNVEKVLIQGPCKDGSYAYDLAANAATAAPSGDNSNSQYAVLGLWALEDAGVILPRKHWMVMSDYWRKAQLASGGWGYEASKEPATHSMTLAGLASIYLVNEFTAGAPALDPKPDPNLDAGLAWLNQNSAAVIAGANLYILYGCERVGLASGNKYFGTVNWYQEGAARILANQQPDGSFVPPATQAYGTAEVNTAFALLFLSRGRNPVAFNKLQYGPVGGAKPSCWNARLRDVNNLTHKLHKTYELGLNWQVVSLATEPEEWIDAPVLLITGSRDPGFTPEDIAKLRKFVEYGGTIFSSADGGKEEFTAAIRRYAEQVAGGQYAMRELPADHPLFSAVSKVKEHAPILGVSNGLRELWVHAPEDYGAVWQSKTWTASPEAVEIPGNLYLTAVDKGSRKQRRLQTLWVAPPKEQPTKKLVLGRLRYNGIWDPEPGAWRRMAALMERDCRLQVSLKPVLPGELDPKKVPAVHVTGVGALKLSMEEEDKLRNYIAGGGLVIADAAGGNVEFAKSWIALLKDLYPDAQLQTLPAECPLYDGTLPQSARIGKVEYRRFLTLTRGQSTEPRIQGLRIGDRWAVIFSADDITSGLLGTQQWGIAGYTPDFAQALARNLLLWAAAPKPAPAP